jgi:hypothetical protein
VTNHARRPQRSIHTTVLTMVGVVVIATLGYGAVTWFSLRGAERNLAATRAELSRGQTSLAAMTHRLAAATADRDTRQAAQVRTQGEIDAAVQSLSSADRAGYLQSVNIDTLHTCLSGVSDAVTAISRSDPAGAVGSIDGASSSCLSLDGSPAGLVYPFDFPDPYILAVGSEYFGFATNSAAGNIQIIQSSDLAHWTTVGDALPHEPAWATPGATWAPSVLQRGSTFVLYYSATYSPTGEQCISEAVATGPQGPYVDSSSQPLICQTALGGSMDPSPFVDADGTPYLVWKSQGAGDQPPTLWSQQLSPDGTALVSGPTTSLLTPGPGWQGGVVEGPDLVMAGGRYLLFYSANNWRTTRYAIGVARCVGPLGPCTEISDRPLLASQPTFSGPGGPSVFTDVHGQPEMAFHAWLPGKVGFPNSRLLFIRPLTLAGGVPSIGS